MVHKPVPAALGFTLADFTLFGERLVYVLALPPFQYYLSLVSGTGIPAWEINYRENRGDKYCLAMFSEFDFSPTKVYNDLRTFTLQPGDNDAPAYNRLVGYLKQWTRTQKLNNLGI